MLTATAPRRSSRTRDPIGMVLVVVGRGRRGIPAISLAWVRYFSPSRLLERVVHEPESPRRSHRAARSSRRSLSFEREGPDIVEQGDRCRAAPRAKTSHPFARVRRNHADRILEGRTRLFGVGTAAPRASIACGPAVALDPFALVRVDREPPREGRALRRPARAPSCSSGKQPRRSAFFRIAGEPQADVASPDRRNRRKKPLVGEARRECLSSIRRARGVAEQARFPRSRVPRRSLTYNHGRARHEPARRRGEDRWQVRARSSASTARAEAA